MHFKLLLWGQRLIERGAWFLAPLGWIWGMVVFFKNRLYDLGWIPAAFVSRPVISIGNIAAGGTGKTPLVHLLARALSHRKVAILSSGYALDEPLLLQRRLPAARVYVGKDRVALAKQAVEEGAELLILDDGFQYRKLGRDFDFVLLSGSDPFGKGHFLPHGFLRDSPKRLAKVDALFISGFGSIALPHISLAVSVDQILDSDGRPIVSIQGWPVALFCGIGRPAIFKKTVFGLGAKVVAEWILADHETADVKKLQSFAVRSKALGAKALICTEKDFVKLALPVQTALPIFFLEISFRVVRGKEEWEKLIAKIEEKIDNMVRHG